MDGPRRISATPLLQKWYVDCIANDGSIVIGYAARLHLGGFDIPFMEVLLDRPNHEHQVHHSWTTLDEPTCRDQSVTWHVPSLGVDATWRGRTPAIDRTLLETPDGSVDWHCHIPCGSARMSLDNGAVQVDGLGCVERLDLTIPPWTLPFTRLRWGHFVSPTHDVNWIDWAGAHPLTLVFLNGSAQSDAAVFDDHVAMNGGRVTLHDSRTIRARSVAEELSIPAPVAKRLPKRMDALFEHKWLSQAVLELPEGTQVDGLALHEQVRFQ